jgi:hypothetical protein
MFQNYLGESANGLTLVTFSVTYADTPAFNPPEGEELASWLDSQWSYLSEDMPTEPNLILGDHPAVLIYAPGGQGVFSTEYIFLLKDGKLFQINMIDVDPEEHREFYELVLSSFRILD